MKSGTSLRVIPARHRSGRIRGKSTSKTCFHRSYYYFFNIGNQKSKKFNISIFSQEVVAEFKDSRMTRQLLRTIARRARMSPSAPDMRMSRRKNKNPVKEIRRLSLVSKLLLPRPALHKVISDINGSLSKKNINYQLAALTVLQGAADAFLTNLFEDSIINCIKSGRTIVTPVDNQEANSKSS